MDNRANIQSAALKLFASRGYDAVGVQEIVAAAGITKPSLYHYFGSKQGLLEAILSENFAELYRSVQQAADYHHDLPLTLERMVVSAFFKFAQSKPVFYRLQLSLWFAPADSLALQAVARLNEQQQALIEAIFLQAAQDHGNMRGRHQAYAATFLGMIHTYIGLALNGYTEFTAELIHKAVHQFMHGIFS